MGDFKKKKGVSSVSASSIDLAGSKNVTSTTREPIQPVNLEPSVVGGLDPRVAAGLISLEVYTSFKPGDGSPPIIRKLWPAPADATTSTPGYFMKRSVSDSKLWGRGPFVNIHNQIEVRIDSKLENVRGSARTGDLSVRHWGWAENGESSCEFVTGFANDDANVPPGDVNGKFSILVHHPKGFLMPRYDRPHMLKFHPGQNDWTEIELPNTNFPDQTARYISYIISWDSLNDALQKYVDPDWKATKGSLQSFIRENESYGQSAASIDESKRSSWLTNYEVDPWADWGHSRTSGRSGWQLRFGVNPIPGVAQGGSNKSADLYRGQLMAVEGHRTQWLDQNQRDFFLPSNDSNSVYWFYKLHSWVESRVGRAGWSVNEYGDFHGWDGYGAEHRESMTPVLAARIACPFTRDMALYFSSTCVPCWGTHGIGDGGFYNGGDATNYNRETTRPSNGIAEGYLLARMYGFTDIMDKFDAHLSYKFDKFVNAPGFNDGGGYRNRKDKFGEPAPWGGSAMPWTRSDGRLKPEDVVGHPYESTHELRRINLAAYWQRMSIGGVLKWALLTNNSDGLTYVRDFLFQAINAVRADDGFGDPSKVFMPKYGNTYYLGLSHISTSNPMPAHQIMEMWLGELFSISLFKDHGVDETLRQNVYSTLYAWYPNRIYERWGSDTTQWEQLASECQPFTLKTLPPSVLGRPWTTVGTE